MSTERQLSAIKAAKLYYNEQLSQSEVAEILGVSRPTVAKLLRFARETGLVTITIHDPQEYSQDLQEELAERFGLRSVTVVNPVSDDDRYLLPELANGAVTQLKTLVSDGMDVGISWGNTMFAVSKALVAQPQPTTGVHVVQLKGGTSHTVKSTFDAETLANFAAGLTAQPVPLPLPVIFDDPTTKNIVEHDRYIASLLEKGRHVDVAVFTVGDIHRQALLMNIGLITDDEITHLLSTAVGDACSRFYTVDGDIADPTIDARTVGISLQELSTRPSRLLVAGGIKKTHAIAVALRMGLATDLVIDAATASQVLEITA